MKIILSHYFSPYGRAGCFHLLRYLPAIASRSGEAGGLRPRHPAYSGITSALSALHMKAFDCGTSAKFKHYLNFVLIIAKCESGFKKRNN